MSHRKTCRGAARILPQFATVRRPRTPGEVRSPASCARFSGRGLFFRGGASVGAGAPAPQPARSEPRRWLHEHELLPYRLFPMMTPAGPRGLFELPAGMPRFPLSLSLMAHTAERTNISIPQVPVVT